ncbi:S-phase kinase-associated protein 2-like [Gigantopelta aegis]|uniref:S-phase kinase-associated protein 2-like n=1 Tax=Gigantopelta aegis TaxID=1735272 RepID=UPI001B88C4E5|nr:S-phase kinase-associated protein 2-like [Gigantopelta aegis]
MAKTKMSKTFMKENCDENPRKRRKLDAGTTKQTWLTKTDRLDDIYREMGVDLLSESSHESCMSITENTPACSVASRNDTLLVPSAPRVLLPCQRDNVSPQSNGTVQSLTPRKIAKKLIYSNYHSKCEYEDFMSKLSDEIMLNIFRWLPKYVLAKCARVCHRWNNLVLDETLWKRIDLSNKNLPPGTLGNVISRGVTILRLAKTEIEDPLFTGLTREIKMTRLTKIQYLDLSMATITMNSLEELFSVCRDLRKISLENADVNEAICCHIGENKYLQTLNLCMCRGITANGLVPITSNCQNLESLNLSWTSLPRHTIVYLVLCLPASLTKLNLSGCRQNITDDDVFQLCKACPKLKELDVSDSTALTCTTVHHVADNLSQLEHLAISRCYHIMPLTIPVLAKLPNLLAIDVFGMLREVLLEQLKKSMTRIEINKFPFSSIARPTTGIRRTSVWGLRVRDNVI